MTTLVQRLSTAIVADDDELGRVLLAESAAAAGLVCQSFGDGAEALGAALQSNVAIALLDVSMPGMDGFEVCRRLRADPGTRHVPVVIISALDDDESRSKAARAGANAYYTKPFSPIALLKEIDRLKERMVSNST